ncbi:TPA: DUF4238 domain-containing protein, partial [Legionella pneumophila]|nr:DUF4238 domain-containing protein [Legionella pneumophila]
MEYILLNHHYIPRFYLKRWIDPSHGKVNNYYYLQDRLLCGKKAPKNLGCLEDLYALDNVADDGKQVLETDHYKSLDDKAAKIMDKMISDGIIALNNREKLSWTDFIISMMTRNAAQVQKSKKDGKPIIERLKENLPGEVKEKFREEIDYYESNIANLAIAAVSGYGELEEPEFTTRFREIFINLNWWIEDYSKLKFNLLTSDRPVIIYPVTPIDKSFNNSSGKVTDLLIIQDFILSLPISPQLCFFAYKKVKPKKSLIQTLKAQNFNLVARAHDYIFSNTLRHDKFIRK